MLFKSLLVSAVAAATATLASAEARPEPWYCHGECGRTVKYATEESVVRLALSTRCLVTVLVVAHPLAFGSELYVLTARTEWRVG